MRALVRALHVLSCGLDLAQNAVDCGFSFEHRDGEQPDQADLKNHPQRPSNAQHSVHGVGCPVYVRSPLPPPHTHTHTHTHTRTHTYGRTRTDTRMCAHPHSHKNAHAHTPHQACAALLHQNAKPGRATEAATEAIRRSHLGWCMAHDVCHATRRRMHSSLMYGTCAVAGHATRATPGRAEAVQRNTAHRMRHPHHRMQHAKCNMQHPHHRMMQPATHASPRGR
jgi:hypothetical protein